MKLVKDTSHNFNNEIPFEIIKFIARKHEGGFIKFSLKDFAKAKKYSECSVHRWIKYLLQSGHLIKVSTHGVFKAKIISLPRTDAAYYVECSRKGRNTRRCFSPYRMIEERGY